jgi:hypothetical protein
MNHPMITRLEVPQCSDGERPVRDVATQVRGWIASSASWCLLWPISRGKNFGYGGPAPVLKGAVVLDLSRVAGSHDAGLASPSRISAAVSGSVSATCEAIDSTTAAATAFSVSGSE